MRPSSLACAAAAVTLAASSASAYALINPPRRWFNPPRLVTVDFRGVPSVTAPDPDHGVSAAVAAVNSWQSGGINPAYGQSGAVAYRMGDGRSDLIFDDPLDICSGNCIAATTTGYYSGSSQTMTCSGTVLRAYTDADVSFNLDFPFNTVAEGACSGEIYLESVVAHEIGHLIGLAHSSSGAALMYPSVAYCSNKPVGADDLAGRNALYSCSGGGGGGATADLTVTVTAPAVAAAGGSLSVTDTTRNAGSGAAAASTTRFYLSLDRKVGSGDVALGSRAVPALAASASSTAATVLTVPAGTAAGIWYVLAQADGAAAVAETSETNNVDDAAVRIGPDLVVSALKVPTEASRGQTVNVNVTTRNTGGAAAPASSTALYLSAGNQASGDVRLTERPVPALATGTSSGGAVAVTIPAGTAPGTYRIVAQADADGQVAEAREGNNTLARTITVR